MIGYTNDMGDKEVAELGDWADYHVKNTPNPEWKRAYALIREGTDLLLRRRAMTRDNPEQEPSTDKKVCTRAHVVEDDGDRKRREDSVREALTTFNDRVD